MDSMLKASGEGSLLSKCCILSYPNPRSNALDIEHKRKKKILQQCLLTPGIPFLNRITTNAKKPKDPFVCKDKHNEIPIPELPIPTPKMTVQGYD